MIREPVREEGQERHVGIQFTSRTIASIIVAILSLILASISFKYSADLWDGRAGLSVLLFLVGNLVSLLGVSATTLALKDNDPNIVFATIGGPGAALLHLSLAIVFQQPLPWWQWTGIGMIVFGATLLHVNPRSLFRQRRLE